MITELLSGFRFSIRSHYEIERSFCSYSTLITRGSIRKRIIILECSINFCPFGLLMMLMYINR